MQKKRGVVMFERFLKPDAGDAAGNNQPQETIEQRITRLEGENQKLKEDGQNKDRAISQQRSEANKFRDEIKRIYSEADIVKADPTNVDALAAFFHLSPESFKQKLKAKTVESLEGEDPSLSTLEADPGYKKLMDLMEGKISQLSNKLDELDRKTKAESQEQLIARHKASVEVALDKNFAGLPVTALNTARQKLILAAAAMGLSDAIPYVQNEMKALQDEFGEAQIEKAKKVAETNKDRPKQKGLEPGAEPKSDGEETKSYEYWEKQFDQATKDMTGLLKEHFVED